MQIYAPLQTTHHLPEKRDILYTKAKEIETAFLAEMLKHTGFNSNSETFSGGIGEEQFQSFLTNQQAKLMTDKGGIGLTEAVFKSLLSRSMDI